MCIVHNPSLILFLRAKRLRLHDKRPSINVAISRNSKVLWQNNKKVMFLKIKPDERLTDCKVAEVND